MLFNLPLSKKKTKPTQPMEIKARANEYGRKLSNTNNISGPTNLHKWLKSRYPYICVWSKKLTRGKSRCSNILFQCQCYSFWLKQTPLYHCTLVFSLTPCILQINGTFTSGRVQCLIVIINTGEHVWLHYKHSDPDREKSSTQRALKHWSFLEHTVKYRLS